MTKRLRIMGVRNAAHDSFFAPGRILENDAPPRPEERLSATLAAELWCTMTGASILRVHDDRPIAPIPDVAEAIAEVE